MKCEKQKQHFVLDLFCEIQIGGCFKLCFCSPQNCHSVNQVAISGPFQVNDLRPAFNQPSQDVSWSQRPENVTSSSYDSTLICVKLQCLHWIKEFTCLRVCNASYSWQMTSAMSCVMKCHWSSLIIPTVIDYCLSCTGTQNKLYMLYVLHNKKKALML